jgi:hypothetical protein
MCSNTYKHRGACNKRWLVDTRTAGAVAKATEDVVPESNSAIKANSKKEKHKPLSGFAKLMQRKETQRLLKVAAAKTAVVAGAVTISTTDARSDAGNRIGTKTASAAESQPLDDLMKVMDGQQKRKILGMSNN